MTPDRVRKLRETLARRQPDLTVLMAGVHKPHNLAAVLRTCDAVGVLDAHAVTEPEVLSRNPNAGAGSRRWVKVRRHDDTAGALAALRARGFRLVAAHPDPAACDFRAIDYTRPTALVLGAELQGLDAATLAACDETIVIPMLGMVQSLNVSVSAALVLYEAQRQRLAAGLYDRCRIDDATFNTRLLEWAHPQVAHRCRMKQIPYPRIDPETLDIVVERGTAFADLLVDRE
ncbi:MAG: tRNA (guanosine(18)-2'-O)-methyltransferase TrmH [Gammaproteobacteria bacterium]|nr:tRNA (guanosine(18)-2'-O)-methyltransferase TrmH [Gammaproteobacteria bacterium]